VLPKSVTPARIEANFTGALAAYNKLTAADVAKLDGVAASGKQKRLITPPWGKWCSFQNTGRAKIRPGVDLGFDNWPVPSSPNK
jgi:glycerol 2-dehydrogenase (NADP+)